MEALTALFEGLTSAFTKYLPALASGIYNMFVGIFLTTGEAGAITGLNALGYIAVGLIGVGIVSGLIATVLGVLRLRKRRGGRRTRRVRA